MTRRLLTPWGGAAAFVLIAGLVVGGLGWVTVAALRVEAAQQEAAARADAANQERLALWQLDSRLFPTLGVETNRPYAHYFALHIPYPVVLPEHGDPAAGPVQVPSPLLSGDLPDWMLLHFQLDPDAGWSSPQVLAPDLEATLRDRLPLTNVTPPRRELLARLKAAFPTEDAVMHFSDRELADLADSPLAVPLAPAAEQPAAPMSAPSPETPAPRPQMSRQAADAPAPQPSARFARGPEAAAERKKQESFREQERMGRGAGARRETDAPGGQPANPATGQTAPPAPPAAGAAPADGTGAVPQNRTVPVIPPPNNSLAGGRAGVKGNAEQSQVPGNFSERENQLKRLYQDYRGGVGNEVQPFNMKPGAQAPPGQPGLPGRPGGDAAKDFAAKPLAAAPAPPAGPPAPGGGYGGAAPGGPGGLPPGPPPVALQSVPGPTADPAVDKKEAGGRTGQRDRDEKAVKEREKDDRREVPKQAELAEGLGAGGAGRSRATGAGEDVARGVPPAERGGRPAEPLSLAKKAAVPLQPPAVHLGPMRPQWLHAPDGTEYLLLVRAARLEAKTVFQGVVLDWPRLQQVLQDEVKPLFPEAALEPVRNPADVSERSMTALPAQLNPGPAPPPPPPGWTALRLGLVIAWVAAAVALVAAGFGGWTLIDLSERRIRFVSAVTHELRTPLTSLRLYLDLLTSGMVRDEEKQREYLTTLHGESDRLNRLIENVLDFARLEKRSVKAHRRPMKLAELLDQVRQTWAERCAADGKDLHVISTLPPDQEVNTDPVMAAQVIGNLIDNARKYTREAADRRIWLWARPGGRRTIVLEVEDRGPGVPPAERGTIFRPFRRGRCADTAAGGAGLGLALAKHWAEMLGGALTCRAADGGVGACFRLELPVS